jgi:ribosomal protein S18 acetylase RimI-like enzyme
MILAEARRAIRPLLDQTTAADATAVYYAFYHPESRVQLIPYPAGADQALGYLALARTGIDLFRPLLTLRLPAEPEQAAEMVYENLPPGTSLFIQAPISYGPLLGAFFDVHREQQLLLFRLDPDRFEPQVNVLVTRDDTPDGLPRFIIRPTAGGHRGDVAASATVNWQSPQFADIAVYTDPQQRGRGWGRTVVTALAHHLLQTGHTPLYHVEPSNEASIQLARRVGFVNTLSDNVWLEATLRPRT